MLNVTLLSLLKNWRKIKDDVYFKLFIFPSECHSVVYCNNILNNNLKIPLKLEWLDDIACIASRGYIATVESSLRRPSFAAEDSWRAERVIVTTATICVHYTLFFCKDLFYKNIELGWNLRSFKNILRIKPEILQRIYLCVENW